MAKQVFLTPTPKPSPRQNRFSREMPVKNYGVRLNEQIRVPQIRLIDDDGALGIMTPQDAMKIARERGVDIIEISANAEPPVCKLMDFGKYRYEMQKRDRVAKASQHKQLIKELRFHPGTDTHDFDFKLRHARTWIEEGHKVKTTVQFKGREIAYKEFGEKLLNRFAEQMSDIAKIDQPISLSGKLMSMMFSSAGKKKSSDKKQNEKAAPSGPTEFAEKLVKVVKKVKIEPLAEQAPEQPSEPTEQV